MQNQEQINEEVTQTIKELMSLQSSEPSTHSKSTPPTVSVFGLGYVGIVSSACLSKLGHQVIGVDTNDKSVKSLNNGIIPIVEPGLEALIQTSLLENKFVASTDISDAIGKSQISFVCVGTPSAPDGSLDLSYLKTVSADIGNCLKHKSEFHVIVFRSTMEPGKTEQVLIPLIEAASGKVANEGFAVCFHPEFLREGTAIEDFFAPPKTVIGSQSEMAAQIVADLYKKKFDDNLIFTSLEVAEMVKYVDNTWHAVKVSFANEIGRICQTCNTDGHEVMDIFCKDRKLNLSPYYLKPGFAFGGSCLPKDVRGMTKLAKAAGIKTPLINSILESNDTQIRHAIDMILKTESKTVAILGLTFKKGTDDLRETPTIPLIAGLLENGIKVKVFDKNIKNRDPLLHYIQHAECATKSVKDFCNNFEKYHAHSIGEVLKDVDTIVITQDSSLFKEIVKDRSDKQAIVDLVRLFKSPENTLNLIQVGMNDYLQKPARARDLDQKLAQHILPTDTTKKGSILLAEDNIPMNTVIQLKLSALGYNVDTVTNGEDAVYMAKTKSYDAILMDLQMPILDGFEATQLIRNLPNKASEVPIIALSANITPEQSRTYYGLCW